MRSCFSIRKSGPVLALLLMVFLHQACTKPQVPKAASASNNVPLSGMSAGHISLWEVYKKLPRTIAYNLADSINFNLARAQWINRQEGLLARIPTSSGRNSWIYIFQPYDDPNDLKAYAVRFYQENTSATSFTGKQIWLDLQDWQVYGVSYTDNKPVTFMEPVKLAEPGWETCMMNNGDFYLDGTGKIKFHEEEQQTGTGMRPTGDPGCGDLWGAGRQSLWDAIGGFLRDVLAGMGEGGGKLNGPPSFGSAGPGNFFPPNGLPGGWPPGYGGGGGGGSVYEPPSEDPLITPRPPNEAGLVFSTTEHPNGPVPEWVVDGPLSENGAQQALVGNPVVAFVSGILGLSQQQTNWLMQHLDKAGNLQTYLLTNIPYLTEDEKKDVARDHIKMMMENTDYLNRINNLTVNWWDRDQNQMIAARKIHMELYLQANPAGMIDCDNINALPMNLYQEVGSYQVPQSVLTRISNIINQNLPAYTTNNFKIRPIQEALGGVVNCDYFYVKINSLPYINNVQMTADQLLEYFRTHWDDFIEPNVNVSFQPYIHYVAGSVNVNETSIFNSPYENSLGSIIHIEMLQNGSVVESGYSRNHVTNQHSFTATTMYTPIDGLHPVSGNRRWGIFQSGGAYYFYTCGVDRTNDFGTTLANFIVNAAFNGADALWHSVQSQMLDFCDTHQGDAVTAEEKIARPEWDIVKQFLLGHKSLQQLKTELHCP